MLGSKAYLDKVRAAEDKKVSQALEKQGVDWTAGPANAGDPHDRTPFPFRFDPADPKMPQLYGAHGLPR